MQRVHTVRRWARRILVSFTFPICILVSAQALGAEPDVTAGEVTAYFDTHLQDPRYDSYVQARRNHLSLNDLEHLDLLTQDGIDISGLTPDKQIEITLYLPVDMEEADRKAFVELLEAHINRRFPRHVLRIEASFLPSNLSGDGGEVQPELQAIDAGLREWSQRAKGLARWAREQSRLPENIDFTLGSVFGLVRASLGVGFWLSVTGANVFGYVQSAVTVALNFVFATYATQFNVWKSEHRLPNLSRSSPIEFYNTHPLVKTLAINELVSYVIQTTFRLMSHLNNPQVIRSPFSAQFLRGFLGLGLFRGSMSAAEDYGGVLLLKKGQISRRTLPYIYNFFGLMSQANVLLFASGQMKWLPVALLIEATAKGAVWLLGTVAPARGNRLILVHPRITPADQDQIEYANDLRKLFLTDESVSKQTLDEILEKYKLRAGGQMPRRQPAKSPSSRDRSYGPMS